MLPLSSSGPTRYNNFTFTKLSFCMFLKFCISWSTIWQTQSFIREFRNLVSVHFLQHSCSHSPQLFSGFVIICICIRQKTRGLFSGPPESLLLVLFAEKKVFSGSRLRGADNIAEHTLSLSLSTSAVPDSNTSLHHWLMHHSWRTADFSIGSSLMSWFSYFKRKKKLST